jgi:hypothetical protein
MNKNVENYVRNHELRIKLLNNMWRDPLVQFYEDKTLPTKTDKKSVFLAGPTSRNQTLMSNWRCEAVDFLRLHGFTGHIYIPEPCGIGDESDFTEKEVVYNWESSRLLSADFVIFWIPRNSTDLLGLNTNLELGILLGKAMSGELGKQKIFIGWPKTAQRMGLPKHYTEISGEKTYSDLESICKMISES